MTEICNQDGCENPGAFRFTWPGRDEAAVCIEHAPQLAGIARAMGLHLQLIPLTLPPRAPHAPEERDGES